MRSWSTSRSWASAERSPRREEMRRHNSTAASIVSDDDGCSVTALSTRSAKETVVKGKKKGGGVVATVPRAKRTVVAQRCAFEAHAFVAATLQQWTEEGVKCENGTCK